jgi:hypothetical protein
VVVCLCNPSLGNRGGGSWVWGHLVQELARPLWKQKV